MGNIVLHIGPQKCGSSSIQSAFSYVGASSTSLRGRLRSTLRPRSDFRFTVLDPALVLRLAGEEPAERDERTIRALLNQGSRQTHVLSHEVLFAALPAVARIAHLAGEAGHHVRVLGYSRRQADFIRSAYCQWLFRDGARVREIYAALGEGGLEPLLFSSVERAMIAAVLTDFHTARHLEGSRLFLWNERYRHLEMLLEPLGGSLSVGHLPSKQHPFSLVADAIDRCQLSVKKIPNWRPTNPQYSSELIEAIATALLDCQEPMPGPHGQNAYLHLAEIRAFREVEARPAFLDTVDDYIATVHQDENIAFCNRHDLDPGYFAPQKTVSKSEAIEAVRDEQERRAGDPVLALQDRDRLIAALAALSYRQFLNGAPPAQNPKADNAFRQT